MHALEIIWEIFFCSFSSLFQIFCVRVRAVFHDVRTVLLYVRTIFLVVRTIRLIRPDVNSSCPDELVFVISTSGHPLSSVWTVNPVGLNHVLPTLQPIFFTPFSSFCRLVLVPCDFYAYFSCACVIFAVSLHPRYVFNTLLLISFKFLCLK
jgi:hypothetical protein